MYQPELDALASAVRRKAQSLLDENKAGNRRDPEIFRHLEKSSELRAEGRLLDGVVAETDAYHAAVAKVARDLLR